MRHELACAIVFGMSLYSCIFASLALAQDPGPFSMNYTFDDLGFKAKTFSDSSRQEVNMTFYSPSRYPESILHPHILVMDEGRVTIDINNASLFSEKLEKGEYFGNITIPSGLIQEGANTLSFIFSPSDYNKIYNYWYNYKITLLGDSAIGFENMYS